MFASMRLETTTGYAHVFAATRCFFPQLLCVSKLASLDYRLNLRILRLKENQNSNLKIGAPVLPVAANKKRIVL